MTARTGAAMRVIVLAFACLCVACGSALPPIPVPDRALPQIDSADASLDLGPGETVAVDGHLPAGRTVRLPLQVTADGELNVFVDGGDGVDATLTLTDDHDALVAFNDDARGLDPQVRAEVTAGRYLVRVAGYIDSGGPGSGPIRIVLWLTPRD